MKLRAEPHLEQQRDRIDQLANHQDDKHIDDVLGTAQKLTSDNEGDQQYRLVDRRGYSVVHTNTWQDAIIQENGITVLQGSENRTENKSRHQNGNAKAQDADASRGNAQTSN